jgi:hypothetical protein
MSWPEDGSEESPKNLNFGHEGALSIRNFVFMMVRMKKSSFKPLN